MAQFGNLQDTEDREERLHVSSVIIGRRIESANELTHHEASQIIDTLGRVKDYNALAALLDAIEKERAEHPE